MLGVNHFWLVCYAAFTVGGRCRLFRVSLFALFTFHMYLTNNTWCVYFLVVYVCVYALLSCPPKHNGRGWRGRSMATAIRTRELLPICDQRRGESCSAYSGLKGLANLQRRWGGGRYFRVWKFFPGGARKFAKADNKRYWNERLGNTYFCFIYVQSFLKTKAYIRVFSSNVTSCCSSWAPEITVPSVKDLPN